MSNENQTTDDTGDATQRAIDAWSSEVVRTLQHTDEVGNQKLALPMLQGYLDTRLLQLKVEALFEELDAEQLVESPRVMSRLLRKLDEERQHAKKANDARPKVQTVTGAVAAAINGSGRKAS